MAVTIVADQGTHSLVSQDNHFATVERGNDRRYDCHDGKRDSIQLNKISAFGLILRDKDWTDEAAARSAFNGTIGRGTDLSQHMR